MSINKDTNKGQSVIKAKENNYYWNQYDYWKTKRQLEIWKEVKESSNSWWIPKLWNFTNSWAWNYSVTWLGFKPSLVTFTYNNASQTWVWSWSMSETSQFAFDYNSKTRSLTGCIYCRNWSWTAVSRAIFVSMDNDWFTINFTVATENVQVWFIAYP